MDRVNELGLDMERRLSAFSASDKQLLFSLRHMRDLREPGEMPILRTCYGPGTDEAFRDLVEEAELDGPVWDDAGSFDFGPEGWQQFFLHIPQLLEMSSEYARSWLEERHNCLRDARQAQINGSDENTEDVADEDEEDEDEEEHAWQWNDFHRAAQVGALFVVDREALDTERILVVWYDDLGRVVRQSRQEPYECSSIVGLMLMDKVWEHTYWVEAEFGTDYEVSKWEKGV